VLEDERFDRVHLVAGAGGSIKQILDGLPHRLGIKAVGIERALAEQIAAKRA